jgi:hypothetical protein
MGSHEQRVMGVQTLVCISPCQNIYITHYLSLQIVLASNKSPRAQDVLSIMLTPFPDLTILDIPIGNSPQIVIAVVAVLMSIWYCSVLYQP